MIHPSPTSKIDPRLARGVLEQVIADAPGKPGHVVVSVPNSNYQLHLRPLGAVTGEVGKRIVGRISAQARRVDVVDTGGRYVEPVFGRPRRVQGKVIETIGETRTIVVDAGMPIHCVLMDERQNAGDFAIGALVSFDVLDGATIEQRG